MQAGSAVHNNHTFEGRNKYTHTHTHTHARTHARTHAHTHTHALHCRRKLARPHTYNHNNILAVLAILNVGPKCHQMLVT